MKPAGTGPVFITGGSAGIGRALAEYHASQGATVGVTGRRAEPLASLAAAWPGRVVPMTVDVRDASAMQAQAAWFIERCGCPSLVYANAGISIGTLTEHAGDADVFREIMDTNVLGVVHAFAPFIAPMQAAGGGTLVGIASVAGLRGLPGAGAYAASKAAAIAYLESLRIECRTTGIRVVTICPGYIATGMTERNPYPMPFLLTVGPHPCRQGPQAAPRQPAARPRLSAPRAGQRLSRRNRLRAVPRSASGSHAHPGWTASG